MIDFAGRQTRNICQGHQNDCRPGANGYCACPLELAPESTAELVCSDLVPADDGDIFGVPRDGLHMPVIDLDLPCRLVESGTPGHFHLYIDKAVPFWHYMSVLNALTEAGIVQAGFRDATGSRGFGSVRHPDRPKVTGHPRESLEWRHVREGGVIILGEARVAA